MAPSVQFGRGAFLSRRDAWLVANSIASSGRLGRPKRSSAATLRRDSITPSTVMVGAWPLCGSRRPPRTPAAQALEVGRSASADLSCTHPSLGGWLPDGAGGLRGLSRTSSGEPSLGLLKSVVLVARTSRTTVTRRATAVGARAGKEKRPHFST
jgi:hypothetical protein